MGAGASAKGQPSAVASTEATQASTSPQKDTSSKPVDGGGKRSKKSQGSSDKKQEATTESPSKSKASASAAGAASGKGKSAKTVKAKDKPRLRKKQVAWDYVAELDTERYSHEVGASASLASLTVGATLFQRCGDGSIVFMLHFVCEGRSPHLEQRQKAGVPQDCCGRKQHLGHSTESEKPRKSLNFSRCRRDDAWHFRFTHTCCCCVLLQSTGSVRIPFDEIHILEHGVGDPVFSDVKLQRFVLCFSFSVECEACGI